MPIAERGGRAAAPWGYRSDVLRDPEIGKTVGEGRAIMIRIRRGPDVLQACSGFREKMASNE